MNRLALLLISFYRAFLASVFGGNCRFYPSCSVYAQEAYAKKGFLEATGLTFKRLSKCHPGGPSGYDPVPEAKPFDSSKLRDVKL